MTTGGHGRGRRRGVTPLLAAVTLIASGAGSAACAALLGFEDGTQLDSDAGETGADSTSEAAAEGAVPPGSDSGRDAAADAAVAADAADAALEAAADAGQDAALDAPLLDGSADAGTKQAFETPLTFNGRLDAPGVAGAGGLAAGDARCMEAAAATFPGRTFVAWLSTAGTSAASRLTGHGPWYIGAAYVGGVSQLTTGALTTAVNKAPNGTAISAPVGVWTGTEANGTPNLSTCSDWTSIDPGTSGEIGTGTAISAVWTYATQRSCDATYHLYCFEQ